MLTIQEFGCFVEIPLCTDGMCPISELADFRVKRVEDIIELWYGSHAAIPLAAVSGLAVNAGVATQEP